MRFEIEGKRSDEQVVQVSLELGGTRYGVFGGVNLIASCRDLCGPIRLLSIIPGKPLVRHIGVGNILGLPIDSEGRVLIEGMVEVKTVANVPSPAAERVLAYAMNPNSKRKPDPTCACDKCHCDKCHRNLGWNACLDKLAQIAGGE